MITSPFLSFPRIEESLKLLIHSGDLDSALKLVAHYIHQNHKNPELQVAKIYTPILDKLLEVLADQLRNIFDQNNAKIHLFSESDSKDLSVIICTELYLTGGHSRLVEVYAQEFDPAVVIATGFWGDLRPPRLLTPAVGDLPLLVLPFEPPSQMVMRLAGILKKLARKVILVGHPHDSVMYAGALVANIEETFFVHHSDGFLSLGTTASKFKHVDVAPHQSVVCGRYLSRGLLRFWPYTPPLQTEPSSYVGDVRGSEIVTASSGASYKFTWEGNESYPQMVASLLRNGVSRHAHVGYLEEEKLGHIYGHLDQNNLGRELFHYAGPVKSLPEELIKLKTSIFIGSNNGVGFGVLVDALSAGVPVLPCYFNQLSKSYGYELNVPRDTLWWSNLSELIQAISTYTKNLPDYSKGARRFFDKYYSRKGFLNWVGSDEYFDS